MKLVLYTAEIFEVCMREMLKCCNPITNTTCLTEVTALSLVNEVAKSTSYITVECWVTESRSPNVALIIIKSRANSHEYIVLA